MVRETTFPSLEDESLKETLTGTKKEEEEEEQGKKKEEPTPPSEEEPTITLADGSKVKLSEVEEWKKGSMMEADYRRKTQELAQERRETQAQRELAEAQLQETTTFMEKLKGGEDKEGGKSLLSTLKEAGYEPSDPLYQMAALQEKKLGELSSKMDERFAQMDKEDERKINTEFEVQERKILEKDPTCNLDVLRGWAVERGYTDLEDAYYLMNREKIIEAEKAKATEEARKSLSTKKESFVESGKGSQFVPPAPKKPTSIKEATALSKKEMKVEE